MPTLAKMPSCSFASNVAEKIAPSLVVHLERHRLRTLGHLCGKRIRSQSDALSSNKGGNKSWRGSAQEVILREMAVDRLEPNEDRKSIRITLPEMERGISLYDFDQ